MAKLRLRSLNAEAARLAAPGVNYMGPEEGPFKCGHCEYFDKGYCANEAIQANVEAEGCCNLYESVEEGPEQEEDE